MVVTAGFAVVVAAAACSSEERGSERSTETRQQPPDLARVQVSAQTAFHLLDDHYVTLGSTFQVSVRGERLELLDRAAQGQAASITFERAKVARGNVAFSSAASAKRLDSGAFAWVGAGWREVWANTGSSLEQAWEFGEKPGGSGDLVLRVPVSGQAFVKQDVLGLHFVDAAGGRGTRYGVATWIDADQQRTPIATRVVGGEIELRVPEGVLESSRFPAVLDPTVSPERPVSSVDYQITSSTKAQVRCTQANCMVAWLRGAEVVIGRFNESTPLDEPQLVVPGANSTFALSSKPNEYLISWMPAAAGPNSARALRIDPASGAFIDDPAAPLALPNYSRVLGLENRYIVTWYNGNGTSMAELNGSGQLVHERVLIDMEDVAPAGVEGNGMVALAWLGHIQRFSGTDLAPIDASAINYPQVLTGVPVVAYDGTHFVLIWGNDRFLRAGRVKASDGSLLEPDDTFNQLPGSVQVDDLVYYSYYADPIGAYRSGNEILAIYGNKRLTMYGIRLQTTGASISVVDDAIIDSFDENPAIRGADYNGTTGLLMSGHDTPRDIYGSTLDKQLVSSARFPLALSPNQVELCGVTSNGEDFLVVWRDAGTEAIYAARLRGDGLVKDPAGLLLSPGPGSCWGAASAAGDFMVAYKEGTGLYVRPISSGGSVGTAKYAGTPDLGRIASDGLRYLLTYSTGSTRYSRRMDATGAFLESAVSHATGGGFVAAGNFEPTEDLRTFMVATLRRDVNDLIIQSKRIRGKVGSVLANADHRLVGAYATDGTDFTLSIASDGEDFAVVWGSNTNVAKGILIDDVDGTLGQVVPLDTAATGTKFSQGSLSFDGTSYALVWGDAAATYGQNTSLYGAYLNTALASEGSPFGVETKAFWRGPQGVASASDLRGRTFVAYARWLDSTRKLGAGIHARYLDNELGLGGHGGYAADGDAGAGGHAEMGGAPNPVVGGAPNSGTAGAPNPGAGGSPEPPMGGEGGGAPSEPSGGAPPSGGNGGTPSGGTAAGNEPSGSGTAGVTQAAGGVAGLTGTGGASSGGLPTEGGALARAGASSAGSEDSGGCGCSVPGRTKRTSWLALLFAAVVLRRLSRGQRAVDRAPRTTGRGTPN
jgi:hypothetical protein